MNPTTQSAALNLSALSTAVPATSTVTIKGTWGTQTATTTFSVTVSPAGFTLYGPGSVQLAPGKSTTASINVSVPPGAPPLPAGVNLSVTGLPAGVTASILPNPSMGTSTLTLTASASAVAGTQTLTVTGKSGSLTSSTTIQLQIHVPAFTVSAPPSITVAQGGTVTNFVYITPQFGFNGTVNLVVSGLPAGVTASWSPASTATTSMLTLTASSTAAFASSTVTITGTSGTLTSSTTLQVLVVPPVFTLSVPGSMNLRPGTTSTTSIFVQWQNGSSNNVSLAISGLPAGVTASLSPASTNSTSVLTLTAASTAAQGQYNALITGTYGKQVSSALLNITVGSVPDFSVFAYSPVQLGRGGSTTSWLYINPQNGFTGSVTLSAVGLPSGVTASFAPNPTVGNSVMTLTASTTASLGQYNATIVGTYGKETASAPISVAVYAPSFALYSSQGPAMSPGSSGQGLVSIQSLYGFTGSVTLSVSGLPAGVTASFLPNPTADQSTVSFAAASTATPGQYNLTIKGVSGSQTATSIMPLVINAPTFGLCCGGMVSVGQGLTGSTFMSVFAQNGFTKPVQLTASGLPAGVTALFSPNPATFLPNSTNVNSTLTLTASSSAAPGGYTVIVTGSGGGQTATMQVPVTVGAPSFTLSGPQMVSLGQAGSSTQYVYVNPQFGFTGAVKFSVTGLPSGVTAIFSPNPTNYMTTLILSATSVVTPGQYSATIVGTSGTQSASWPFSLSVGAASFTLGGGGNVDLGQGQSASTSIWVYPSFGFSGQVTFSIAGLPAGVTAAFSPNPSPSYTSITLTASSTVTPGTYNATISGTSGTAKATTPLTITVGVPGFTISPSGTLRVGQGSSSQAYFYVYPTFGSSSPNVTLSVTGLPSGMTASFSPNPTTFNSVLTLTASTSVPVGNYTLTVTGTAGSQHSSTPVQVTVSVPTFTLYSSGVTLGQGTSSTTYVSVYPQNGFTGSVQFAISGLPSGVTASFSPNPSTSSSTLTLTASSTAALGGYNVTITGTSGKQTASIAVPVNIYAPTFTLSGTGGVVVGRGTSTTTYVFVYPQYGFAGNVQFSATGLPAGVTASFSPNPTSSSTTLTLTASSTATLGDYKFTVTGTSGSQKASIISTVGVYVPIFTIYGPNSMSIGQGTAISTTISISPQYGFAGSVQFAISGLPSGVTASFSSNPATIGTTLTLTASGTAPLGQYTLTVTGTSGSQSASTTIALGVYVPTFTLAAYSGGSIGQGGTSTTTLWVYPQYGFTGNVQFSVSGLPSGVTASFSPNPTNSTSTLTLTASSTAAVGQYTIKVTGTSGTQTVSTTFSLGVFVPTFTLYDYSPVYLSAGGTGVSYVYITDEYGFNGNVQLSVSGLPSGVTASFSPNPTSTSSTLTLTAGSSAASGQYRIIINGVSGSQSSSTTLGVIVK